jgi:hypothetical protein
VADEIEGEIYMADDTDVLIKHCDEARQEMRHIENQRATMTNMTILITSVIIGYIGQHPLDLALIPVSVLMIFLGAYGIVFTSKLYERHQFAQSRIDHWTKYIDKLHPKSNLLKLRTMADQEHAAQFPKLSKVRLNRLWIILHATIMLVGVGITLLIVVVSL